MWTQLLHLLPQSPTAGMAILAGTAAVVGAFFLFAGSTVLRSTQTMLAILLAAAAGWIAPMIWPIGINRAALCATAAVVLGVWSYANPRFWTALYAAAAAALWTAAGVFAHYNRDIAWVWPEIADGTTLPVYARELWAMMPGSSKDLLPIAAPVAASLVFSLALIWTRLGRLLLCTLAGLGLLLPGAAVVIKSQQPQWLTLIPGDVAIQSAVLAGAALLGIGVQALLTRARKPEAGKGEAAKPAKDSKDAKKAAA